MPDSTNPPSLPELRKDIDRIDESMHRLLIERSEIIGRLIAVKKSQESGSAFRPAPPSTAALTDLGISIQPEDIILMSPDSNHPALWSGRQTIMGYDGWIWSHGWGDFNLRKADTQSIYEGKPEAKELIRRYHIGAVIVTDKEKYHFKINRDFLDQAGNYRPWKKDYEIWLIKKTKLQP